MFTGSTPAKGLINVQCRQWLLDLRQELLIRGFLDMVIV